MKKIIFLLLPIFLFGCKTSKKYTKGKYDLVNQCNESFKVTYGKDLDVNAVKVITGSELKTWINTNGWGRTTHFPCDLLQLKDLIDKGNVDPVPIALNLDGALSSQTIHAIYISMPSTGINCDKKHTGFIIDDRDKECDKWAHCGGDFGVKCYCVCTMQCGEADIDCGYCPDK